MKLHILMITAALFAGLHVAARDLAQIKNFSELERLDFEKLSSADQDQLLNLALRSGLQPQVAAARAALSKSARFKGVDWNQLVQLELNNGRKGVKTELGLLPIDLKKDKEADAQVKEWQARVDAFMQEVNQQLSYTTDILLLKRFLDKGADLQNAIGASELPDEAKVDLMYGPMDQLLDDVQEKIQDLEKKGVSREIEQLRQNVSVSLLRANASVSNPVVKEVIQSNRERLVEVRDNVVDAKKINQKERESFLAQIDAALQEIDRKLSSME